MRNLEDKYWKDMMQLKQTSSPCLETEHKFNHEHV